MQYDDEDLEEQLTDGSKHDNDWQLDVTLRPSSFDDFVGQERVVKNLKIAIEAAKKRNEAVDHILLSGPPGLGKTTLANLISREMGVDFKDTQAPALEKQGDIVGLLTNLTEKAVFFLDEIHGLRRGVDEYLYSAIEDCKIDIILDTGPSARSITLPLKPFTLVGATTREGLLKAPFRARFIVRERLDYYEPEDLARIISRSAGILDIDVDPAATDVLSHSSRGTPRVANRLLRLARSLAIATGKKSITKEVAEETLVNHRIDKWGLEEMDRMILKVLVDNAPAPVGLKTLSEIVEEEPATIESHYEPYLLKLGMILKTSRGRKALPKAAEALGVTLGEKTMFDR
ncbi:MAG: Holliday junction branch migration DNA helicase RuvB [Planctomycetes bacterium]|nr:Holliday junction branch migration DNA helicase RuvB [Planctomycetota bacterium]